MSPLIKIAILAFVVVGEIMAGFILLRSGRRNALVIPIFAASAVISVAVTALVLFLVVD